MCNIVIILYNVLNYITVLHSTICCYYTSVIGVFFLFVFYYLYHNKRVNEEAPNSLLHVKNIQNHTFHAWFLI